MAAMSFARDDDENRKGLYVCFSWLPIKDLSVEVKIVGI